MEPMATDKQAGLAIIFDFGNVLIKWSPYNIYRKILGDDPQAVDELLKKIDFHTWNIQMDRGRPFAEVIPEVCKRFPEYADLIRTYDERYEESLVVLQPSVDILLELKKAGWPLYGLSNWSAEKFALVRRKLDFFDSFCDIVISGEVGEIKPEPRIYEILLERIGRPAGECLFIDDSPENICAAEELGFQTILFQSPEQLKNELQLRGLLN